MEQVCPKAWKKEQVADGANHARGHEWRCRGNARTFGAVRHDRPYLEPVRQQASNH